MTKIITYCHSPLHTVFHSSFVASLSTIETKIINNITCDGKVELHLFVSNFMSAYLHWFSIPNLPQFYKIV